MERSMGPVHSMSRRSPGSVVTSADPTRNRALPLLVYGIHQEPGDSSVDHGPGVTLIDPAMRTSGVSSLLGIGT